MFSSCVNTFLAYSYSKFALKLTSKLPSQAILCAKAAAKLPAEPNITILPSQRAEAILNKSSNNINKTYTVLISVLQGFQKCIA